MKSHIKKALVSASILMVMALIATTLTAQAAIPPKARFLEGNASQRGGMAGAGFTLLDMRRSSDPKKKVERVVLDMGDLKGALHEGLPGYFHVELKEHPNRLVLDLEQTPHTRIDEKKLAQIFSQSLAVKKTAMTVDPSDNTLNIILDLKQKTKVRVLQVPGKKQTSKIVLDMVIR